MSATTIEDRGVWAEVVSESLCQRCAAAGRRNRLSHTTSREAGLATFQERCYTCHFVRTIAYELTGRGQRSAGSVRRRSSRLFYAAAAAIVLALSILAFAAGSTYAAP
jgi:hypothetical protein